MYKLISAVLMAKVKPKGLVEVDISGFTLKSVLENYKLGYLVLENNHLPDELFLDINTLKKTNLGISNYDITIIDWLEINGDKLLPHTLVEPEFEFSKINYGDGYQSGFNRTAVHPYSTIDNYPISSKTALYIDKDGVSADQLNDNVVCVINGYLHNHNKFRQGVKILDGCKTIMYSKKNHLGLLSFKDAGGVKNYALGMEMIHKGPAGLPYIKEVILELGVDLTDKTVFLSIAGNFIYSNEVYRIIDGVNGIISLNLSRLNFIDRIQQTIKTIEMPEILLRAENDRLYNLSKETIQSDPFILDVLRMSQTFVIVANQPNCVIDKKPLNYNGNYGVYFSGRFDFNPVVDAYGRIVPYFHYGNQKHPFMKDKHIYQIPLEFAEKTQNVRNRHPYLHDPLTFDESVTEHTDPMPCNWLNLNFIKPL